MAYRYIEIDRVTPTLGAEIRGIQLRDCSEDAFAELMDAWAEHLVLFFRDQPLSVDEQIAFGRRLGELHVHPQSPIAEGKPEAMVVHADADSKYVFGDGWHTDVSCDECPPAASLLYLHTVPKHGGDTLWCSTYAAYDQLSDTMKEFLGKLIAVHESAHIYGDAYRGNAAESRDGKYPSAEHPVVRTHPVTGKKSLYVNRAFTTRIRGLRRAESDALLGMLFDHCERPEFQVRFRWTPNTAALWDNRCTMHNAVWDYYPETRSGVRVSVIGERPV